MWLTFDKNLSSLNEVGKSFPFTIRPKFLIFDKIFTPDLYACFLVWYARQKKFSWIVIYDAVVPLWLLCTTCSRVRLEGYFCQIGWHRSLFINETFASGQWKVGANWNNFNYLLVTPIIYSVQIEQIWFFGANFAFFEFGAENYVQKTSTRRRTMRIRQNWRKGVTTTTTKKKFLEARASSARA